MCTELSAQRNETLLYKTFLFILITECSQYYLISDSLFLPLSSVLCQTAPFFRQIGLLRDCSWTWEIHSRKCQIGHNFLIYLLMSNVVASIF